MPICSQCRASTEGKIDEIRLLSNEGHSALLRIARTEADWRNIRAMNDAS